MTTGLSFRSIASERVAAYAVTLFTIGFWLVIATFPNFFLFNPFETADPVFRVEQIFSTSAWVVFGIFPMLFAWLKTINGKSTRTLFQLSVGLWPLAVLVIQVTLAVRGFGFYKYLASYPILAFDDIIVPLFLLATSKVLFPDRIQAD